jgi:hypothetical protein
LFSVNWPSARPAHFDTTHTSPADPWTGLSDAHQEIHRIIHSRMGKVGNIQLVRTRKPTHGATMPTVENSFQKDLTDSKKLGPLPGRGEEASPNTTLTSRSFSRRPSSPLPWTLEQ